MEFLFVSKMFISFNFLDGSSYLTLLESNSAGWAIQQESCEKGITHFIKNHFVEFSVG